MTTLMRRNGNGVGNLRMLSPLEDLENMVNRMFEPYYASSEGNLLNFPIELKEKGNEFTLKARLAGLKKEDISVEVGEDCVSISGEYKNEEHDDDTMIYRSEFSSGNFSRSIGLPAKIDHQKAKADYNDGVLTLILPKSEEEKQKITKLSF